MRIFPANTTNVRYEIPWNEQDDDISMPAGFEDYLDSTADKAIDALRATKQKILLRNVQGN
ncbi:hypothetical protein HBH98_203380 [Parastagonospora nodorum]|nr:hypothetical protein HBI09_226540 [Parastagonospora nodorum]KAH4120065.1 hypothetical protein HBH47_119950 [Parastagonospora nodorum]KAH4188749.1 hypothetical protein HBI95_229550 [Parastagonospora nodorum]KAH4339752.1 hypothetical protein HBH98_203380 [Parastagonospora nodorum]KAH4463400.1 hypothetical protein HBH90_121350 [Parastagonospora nodorum]